MNPTRQMIVDYAEVLNEYNMAHRKDNGYVPFCAKTHNPYMPSGDTTLNALMAFETNLAKKFKFATVRLMKVEAVNILTKEST